MRTRGSNPCTRSVDSLTDLFITRRADFEKAMAVDKWKEDDEYQGEAAEGPDDEHEGEAAEGSDLLSFRKRPRTVS
jgi:hypothetical protein